MTKINYKSDFDFILKLKDGKGEDIGWPDYDWTAKFWTSSKANTFAVSYIGTECRNCFNDSGQIHVVMDNHRLSAGQLKMEFTAVLPDGIYPDGDERVVSTMALDVCLTKDTETPTTAEVEAVLPYIKGEPFTFEDFTPEQIAELQRPATEAASSVLKLEKNVETAEKKRIADEQSRQEAEQARIGAEETRESNESVRQENEQERKKAETDRQTAEEERAEEFADWEAEINSKAYRSELSNVFAEETLTSDNFPDINTYTREELKMDLFIDMWNSAWWERNRFGKETIWGKYDPDNAPDAEHPFYGNKLWMTYDEAIRVLLAGRLKFLKESEYYKYNCNIRTNLPPERGNSNATILNSTFYDAAYIETALLRNDVILKTTFDGCKRLREVLSIDTIRSSDLQAFRDCVNLEFVEFRGVTGNIYLQYCPKIKIESLNLLVSTAQNTTSISVYVHQDVFAKLTDETNTDWHALLALAAEKNISFATV